MTEQQGILNEGHTATIPDPMRIAIVNAYSSASILPAAFRAHGAEVYHVQSGASIPVVFAASFRPDDFVTNIVHAGDLGQTCRSLQNHGVGQVVAGSEYGVELSEQLAEMIGSTTNPVATIPARRNKFAMIERLAAADIPSVQQALATCVEDIRRFCANNPGRTVVKPVNAGGSDGVTFCDDVDQAVAAFETLCGRSNAFDLNNDAVVVQSYLDGTEYYVNTMSRDRVHRVAEIWECTHVSANGIRNLLDSAVLMPPEGPVQEILVDYAFKCLDGLDVVNSPAHIEIKMTADGPRLIELGARIVGGPLSRIARLGIRESQIDLIAKAYCDKSAFLSEPAQCYEPHCYMAAVSLIAPRSGILRGYPRLAEIEALESYRETIRLVCPGDRITRTHNDFTYALMIVLAHPDRFAVERDSRTVRHIDGTDFYDIAD